MKCIGLYGCGEEDSPARAEEYLLLVTKGRLNQVCMAPQLYVSTFQAACRG
jgi:hypothetical protein